MAAKENSSSIYYVKKTGWLVKRPSVGRIIGRWRKRWCMLIDLVKPEAQTGTPGRLVRLEYYTEDPMASGLKERPKMKGMIDLRSCIAIVNHDKKLKGYNFVFNIILPNSIHYLAASSEEERKDWVKALNEFIFTVPVQSQSYFQYDVSKLDKLTYTDFVTSSFYKSSIIDEHVAVLNPNDRKMKTLLREKKLQAAAVNPDDDFCKLDERDMWRRAQRARERAREGLHEHKQESYHSTHDSNDIAESKQAVSKNLDTNHGKELESDFSGEEESLYWNDPLPCPAVLPSYPRRLHSSKMSNSSDELFRQHGKLYKVKLPQVDCRKRWSLSSTENDFDDEDAGLTQTDSSLLDKAEGSSSSYANHLQDRTKDRHQLLCASSISLPEVCAKRESFSNVQNSLSDGGGDLEAEEESYYNEVLIVAKPVYSNLMSVSTQGNALPQVSVDRGESRSRGGQGEEDSEVEEKTTTRNAVETTGSVKESGEYCNLEILKNAKTDSLRSELEITVGRESDHLYYNLRGKDRFNNLEDFLELRAAANSQPKALDSEVRDLDSQNKEHQYYNLHSSLPVFPEGASVLTKTHSSWKSKKPSKKPAIIARRQQTSSNPLKFARNPTNVVVAKAKPVPPVKRKKMEKNSKSLLDTSREGSRDQLAKAPLIAVKSQPLQVSPKPKSDAKLPQAQKLPSSIVKSEFTAGSKKSGEILDTGSPKMGHLMLVSSKEAQRQHKLLVKSVSSQILRPKVCKTPLLPPTHKKKVDSSGGRNGVNLASTSGHLGLLEDAKDNTTNVEESEKELVYDYIDSNHARYYVGISSQ